MLSGCKQHIRHEDMKTWRRKDVSCLGISRRASISYSVLHTRNMRSIVAKTESSIFPQDFQRERWGKRHDKNSDRHPQRSKTKDQRLKRRKRKGTSKHSQYTSFNPTRCCVCAYSLVSLYRTRTEKKKKVNKTTPQMTRHTRREQHSL